MIRSYELRDLEKYEKYAQLFLEIADITADVLSCSPYFSAENWIRSARNVLPQADRRTQDLFEFNARALITTWGRYRQSIAGLLDYSNRQWAEIIRDYALPRWKEFITRHREALASGKAPEPADYWQMEWTWANKKSSPANEREHKADTKIPVPDLKALARTVYGKYSAAELERSIRMPAGKQPVNLASGLVFTGSVEADAGHPYSNLTNGALDATWKAAGNSWPVELTLDLKGDHEIQAVSFTFPQIAGDFPLDYSIQVFHNETWQEIPVQSGSHLIGTVSVPCRCTASAVRLILVPAKGREDLVAELADISVYGDPQIAEEGEAEN